MTKVTRPLLSVPASLRPRTEDSRNAPVSSLVARSLHHIPDGLRKDATSHRISGVVTDVDGGGGVGGKRTGG